MNRLLRGFLFAAVALAFVAVAAGPAAAKKSSPRKGGHIVSAWPHGHGKAPKTVLQRWLARQVGPRKPPASHAKAAFLKTTTDSQSIGATIPSSAQVDTLKLVRSFDIPKGDPSYDRLLNWSWTYDSAATAAAFSAAGYTTQAEQLLDQLKALQHKDGSIETAFNVYSGASSQQLRSGTVAWVGLAAATYDAAKLSTRYGSVARDAGDWLLTQRVTDSASPVKGLIKGGPDVTWVSTQHNLIAYSLFVRLGLDPTSGSKAATYLRAADQISDGIDSQLLVKPTSSTASFKEGFGDDVRPLDTQVFGALYLLGHGQAATAAKVRSYIESAFATGGRSIVKSTIPASFNNTFAAAGPLSGYRPYSAGSGPDALWAEGTAEVRLLKAGLRESTGSLDLANQTWDRITTGSGPLQADRTAADSLNEYHVWPAAAPGAWRILSAWPTTYFVGVNR